MSPSLHIHVLSLAPAWMDLWFQAGIWRSAIQKNALAITQYHLRDFGIGPHSQVDSPAFGGGGGMLLRVDALAAAVTYIRNRTTPHRLYVIALDPKGTRFTANWVNHFLAPGHPKHILLVCGRYEGMDARFEAYIDTSLSVGDFVVSGGELGALLITDALLRQAPGTFGRKDAATHESFHFHDPQGEPLLEYPQYTHPVEYNGLTVPPVLRSGNHLRIADWRQKHMRNATPPGWEIPPLPT